MIRPIDNIVSILAEKVRVEPSGVKSLSHLLVVVPTVQAGRRLRLALAKRLGALVPPTVLTSRGFMLDESDPALAGRTDELIAFKAAGIDYPLAVQLSDMRRILEPGAVSFGDVAALLAKEMPEEAKRWEELALTEKQYLEQLEKRGRKDRIAAMKEYARLSAGEKWPGVEEVVRLDDPAAFLRDGAEDCTLPRSRIFPASTPADEAWRVAEYFAAVRPDEELPALSVVDPGLFPEIVSAFRAKGLEVHNPARIRLATSSLGRLTAAVAALMTTRSYSVFSSFVRCGDVRRWLSARLSLTPQEMAETLIELDRRQAEYLPEKIDDIGPKTTGKLRAVFELIGQYLARRDIRRILTAIFKDRILDERDASAREFAAAAEAVDALLEECAVLPGEDGRMQTDVELFSLRLDEAVYSLEPDEGEVIVAEGWLDLPFVDAGEVVVAGFCEGIVPESTMGHPFLPDSLRVRLGIPGNAAHEMRDRAILKVLVQSRPPAALRFSFHAIDAAGDAVKPSRLLLETADDADLVERVRRFYGSRAGTAEAPARDLPKAWKLRLPVPPPYAALERISPTRLDDYLACPFTCYLKDKSVLGDKRMDDRAEELAAWEYGNLAHEALEAFGLSPLADSVDAGEIKAFLGESVDRRLVARFGTSIPAIVAMQGESIKRRLAAFASVQAARRAAGWRIVACERKLEVQYGHTRIRGKCDRIDYNDESGEWCVIDYKTWDTAARAASYDAGKNEWKSLQLPLYCAMLDADADEGFAAARLERISAAYCVLGKTAEEVCFSEPFHGGAVPGAEAKVRELIARMESGIFWPPSPAGEWKWDYADWLRPSPEESVDEDWIKDQLGRKPVD